MSFPRRSFVIWAVTAAVFAVMTVLFLAIGLDRADKSASVIGGFCGVVSLALTVVSFLKERAARRTADSPDALFKDIGGGGGGGGGGSVGADGGMGGAPEVTKNADGSLFYRVAGAAGGMGGVTGGGGGGGGGGSYGGAGGKGGGPDGGGGGEGSAKKDPTPREPSIRAGDGEGGGGRGGFGYGAGGGGAGPGGGGGGGGFDLYAELRARGMSPDDPRITWHGPRPGEDQSRDQA